MGAREVLVERKLVTRRFLIEMTVVCGLFFLYIWFDRYPLFDLRHISSLYEEVGYALGFVMMAFPFWRLYDDFKDKVACKGWRFIIRLIVVFGMPWMYHSLVLA